MISSECAFLLSPKGQNCVVLQHRGDELRHECFAHTLEIKPNITIVLKVQELRVSGRYNVLHVSILHDGSPDQVAS